MSLVGDRLDQLRRIPLPAVLRETGAQRDRYDQAKWHTPKGTISITEKGLLGFAARKAGSAG